MPPKGAEIIDIEDGRVMAETEKAWRFAHGDDLVWLPKSQCEWDPDSKTMTMPTWLANERGLI